MPDRPRHPRVTRAADRRLDTTGGLTPTRVAAARAAAAGGILTVGLAVLVLVADLDAATLGRWAWVIPVAGAGLRILEGRADAAAGQPLQDAYVGGHDVPALGRHPTASPAGRGERPARGAGERPRRAGRPNPWPGERLT